MVFKVPLKQCCSHCVHGNKAKNWGGFFTDSISVVIGRCASAYASAAKAPDLPASLREAAPPWAAGSNTGSLAMSSSEAVVQMTGLPPRSVWRAKWEDGKGLSVPRRSYVLLGSILSIPPASRAVPAPHLQRSPISSWLPGVRPLDLQLGPTWFAAVFTGRTLFRLFKRILRMKGGVQSVNCTFPCSACQRQQLDTQKLVH